MPDIILAVVAWVVVYTASSAWISYLTRRLPEMPRRGVTMLLSGLLAITVLFLVALIPYKWADIHLTSCRIITAGFLVSFIMLVELFIVLISFAITKRRNKSSPTRI